LQHVSLSRGHSVLPLVRFAHHDMRINCGWLGLRSFQLETQFPWLARNDTGLLRRITVGMLIDEPVKGSTERVGLTTVCEGNDTNGATLHSGEEVLIIVTGDDGGGGATTLRLEPAFGSEVTQLASASLSRSWDAAQAMWRSWESVSWSADPDGRPVSSGDPWIFSTHTSSACSFSPKKRSKASRAEDSLINDLEYRSIS